MTNHVCLNLVVTRLAGQDALDTAAHLFGECIGEHWPVDGPLEAYEWVCKEFVHHQTIVLGVYDEEQRLVACMAATPLEVVWSHLQPEERNHITIRTCSLPESEGLEIPGGMVHVGGIAVRAAYRGSKLGLVKRMFEEMRELILNELKRTFVVAQTARPSELWPLRGLLCCELLGFQEYEGNAQLPPTVGGLGKVWMWRTL